MVNIFNELIKKSSFIHTEIITILDEVSSTLAQAHNIDTFLQRVVESYKKYLRLLLVLFLLLMKNEKSYF